MWGVGLQAESLEGVRLFDFLVMDYGLTKLRNTELKDFFLL